MYTYQDAVEHLLDIFDLEATDRNYRQCRRAIDETYRELPQRARWSYFDRRYTLETDAPYSTGTISFDLTGGTYERQLTLSGGTWPTWSRFGRIQMTDAIYDVQERVSDTVLILSERTSPDADFTDQTYAINRIEYNLPADCRRVLRVYSQERRYMIPIATIDQIRDSNLVESTSSTPWKVGVHGSTTLYGRQALVFNPCPSDDRHFDVWYEISPRPLTTMRESIGTISFSAATVTGTDTTFTSAMEGSILRVGASTDKEPTSPMGNRSDNGAFNPPAFESRIVRVNSATSLLLETSTTTTYTGVKYSISDPIDVEQTSMWTAFLRGAEYALSRMTNESRTQQRSADYIQAIRFAMEDDQRVARTDTYPIVGPGPKILTK